jgi:hypothetical protein
MICRAAEGASGLVGVGVVGANGLLAIEFGACPKSVAEACQARTSYIFVCSFGCLPKWG